jgi:hypothetical protein
MAVPPLCCCFDPAIRIARKPKSDTVAAGGCGRIPVSPELKTISKAAAVSAGPGDAGRNSIALYWYMVKVPLFAGFDPVLFFSIDLDMHAAYRNFVRYHNIRYSMPLQAITYCIFESVPFYCHK